MGGNDEVERSVLKLRIWRGGEVEEKVDEDAVDVGRARFLELEDDDDDVGARSDAFFTFVEDFLKLERRSVKLLIVIFVT